MQVTRRTTSTTTLGPLADGLYHRDIGLPAGSAALFLGTLEPEYTKHATDAAWQDRFRRIELPRSITVAEGQVIEIEVRGGNVVKAVVRLGYDEAHDIVMAICRPIGGFTVVKTVWLNRKHDGHKTLRREIYQTV